MSLDSLLRRLSDEMLVLIELVPGWMGTVIPDKANVRVERNNPRCPPRKCMGTGSW